MNNYFGMAEHASKILKARDLEIEGLKGLLERITKENIRLKENLKVGGF